MQPTAQSLIIDLLSAAGGAPMPVRALVGAAAVFGITENNVRVALARLVSSGKLERNERGSYGIAPAAHAVQRHVVSWSRIADRMIEWRGGWIGAHTAGLDNRNRAAARRRRRALDLLGLRELAPGLYVRPDNLDGGVRRTRAELVELGLDPAAPVFGLAELDSDTDARARRLWDAAEIETGYRDTCRELASSKRHLDDLPIEQAMVECFLLGGRAIRQLAYDPLLPEPIVSAAARRALIEEMRAYDRAGRDCWRRYLRAQGAPALESLLEYRIVEGAV